MIEITIHTDGSCQTQTHSGGWAAVLMSGTHRMVLSGSAEETTVNAMELMAAVNGLKALKRANQTVMLVTDSQYVTRGVNEWLSAWIERGWLTTNKNPVANRNLWEQMNGLLAQHHVTVMWVPREQNIEADGLAQEARLNHGLTATKAVQTITHLMIAGSRTATSQMLAYARRAVRRAHDRGYTVIVGDNPKGVDMAVIRECRRLKTPVIVAGPSNFPRNGGCKHGQYVMVHPDTYSAANGRRLNRYTVRDRWLADTAQIGLFIWNGASPGTKAGFDYMIGRNKDAHLINFGAEV
ncbi:MAG: ribonuclease HI [Anaerolineaceae bacterium]|nr:ribonuclease HI [Anaerolineaceae bacterium]